MHAQRLTDQIRKETALGLRILAVIILLAQFVPLALPAAEISLLTKTSKNPDCVTIASDKGDAELVVDDQDYPVVRIAANLFADDVKRVVGRRLVVTNAAGSSPQVIIVGTLGKSSLLQKLADGGKLAGVEKIKGGWESTLTAVVPNPLPNVDKALVIVGSDRRGAAYGLMQLSQIIGVSPWYWWADVPVAHRETLAVQISASQTDAPAVKYRGIFINDEDWGIFPWAVKTFDPDLKNIGPKTYEKVFELMLRLKLNYFWPAMHACSTEFGAIPENYLLADKFGIVAGSSHCEPMLCNNVHWSEREKGRWNYTLNRDTIHSYWEQNVKARGAEEAVWTIGIRGIHDMGMQSPPSDMPGRINVLNDVFRDQRELLNKYVTKEFGAVAQSFVPYKEVLPIYDAGLKVPEDVTLVWVDDNFGYIRRLSNPAERSRPGGSGVYWHISYYGGPHSYTWINTTAPALIWEEMHKAWENEARTMWVLNVGDLKPMEIGVDYFARLAWRPEGFPLGAQRQYLTDFARENFGPKVAPRMTDLLMEFYRLGTVRKPELMERNWALSLAPECAKQLEEDYQALLDRERAVARAVPAASRDAYFELVGFPARVLGISGEIFMADRKIQQKKDAESNEKKIASLRTELDDAVGHYNTNIAGGKWNLMMPGSVTARNLTAWNSQVRWPWGEPTNRPPVVRPDIAEKNWRNAAAWNRQTATNQARWSVIEGLGPSGKAVALQPASLASSWAENDPKAPTLEFSFTSKAGGAEAWVDFLPTFRLYPGMKLRIAAGVDNGASTLIEVPGSSGAENENGQIRSQGVQNNYVRARVPLPALTAGKHTFFIRAVDPGVVIDRIQLPSK